LKSKRREFASSRKKKDSHSIKKREDLRVRSRKLKFKLKWLLNNKDLRFQS